MKIYILIWFSILSLKISGQPLFIYSEQSPQSNIILDVLITNENIFALEYAVDTAKSSDLIIFDYDGLLQSRTQISTQHFVAMRFLGLVKTA